MTRRRSAARRTTHALVACVCVLVASCGDDAAGTPDDCLRRLGVLEGADFVQFVDYDRARADGFLQPDDDLGSLDPLEQRATTDHYIRLQRDLGLQLPATFLRAFERFNPTGIGVVDVRCAVASRSAEAIRLAHEDVISLDRATPHQDGDLLMVTWDSESPPELDRAGDTPIQQVIAALTAAAVFQGVARDADETGEALGWGIARAGDRNELVIVRLDTDAGDTTVQDAAERALASSRAKDSGTAEIVDLDGATIEVVDRVATTRLTVIGGVPMVEAISSRLDPLVAPSHFQD